MGVLDLVGLVLVCITAIVCTGILAQPPAKAEDDDKTT